MPFRGPVPGAGIVIAVATRVSKSGCSLNRNLTRSRHLIVRDRQCGQNMSVPENSFLMSRFVMEIDQE